MKIIDRPKHKTLVKLSLAEVLHRQFYIGVDEGDGKGTLVPSGDTIADGIRRQAWIALMRNANQFKEDDYKFADVEVSGEEVIVSFFREYPQLPDDPGGRDGSTKD